MNFLNQVQKYADEAPEAAFRQLNYGKLTITPLVKKWGGKGVTPVITEMTEGQELKENETLRLRFSVDVKEFNPSLDFEWYREVDVKKTKKDKHGNKVAGTETDWSEIVLPSLENVFGKKWAAAANGSYVEVEDVASFEGTYTSKKDGKEKQLNTVEFLCKFDNKAECEKARNETYKKHDGEEDTVSGLPANIVAQAKTLYQSVSQNDETFKALVAQVEELKEYDPAILLAAANPI